MKFEVYEEQTLVLIACSGLKKSEPAAACDLYQGQLFKLSVACAQAHGLPWAVLSAKYGLVDPDEVIKPYEQRLSKIKANQLAWAVDVSRVILNLKVKPSTVIFLAGKDYRIHLSGILESAGIRTYSPLQGLSIGYQLSMLKRLDLTTHTCHKVN